MKDLFTNLMKRLRLLPVLVVVASLSFMVRVGDTFMQVKHMSGAAYAEEAPVKVTDAKEPDTTKLAKPGDAPAAAPKDPIDDAGEKASTADIGKKDAMTGGPDSVKLPTVPDAKTETVVKDSNKKEWADSETDFDDSTVRKEVYQDLMARRQLLDQKEKDLERREALLKAGTEEVNKKVEELSSIKNEIQGLLKKQTSEEAANTDRLVKIYEGMKPKEAARIFNQLDMDVLLSVVAKMSERKVSPIIAVMDPDKARNLTLFLSEQNKLPGASTAPAGFGDPMKPPALPESAVR